MAVTENAASEDESYASQVETALSGNVWSENTMSSARADGEATPSQESALCNTSACRPKMCGATNSLSDFLYGQGMQEEGRRRQCLARVIHHQTLMDTEPTPLENCRASRWPAQHSFPDARSTLE